MSNPDFTKETSLGFSAQDFLANVERTDQSVAFEWVAYDQSVITASSPAVGGLTTAVVSIGRTSALPRLIQSTRNECLSYLEVDVLYSIATADGLLAESIPITITDIEDAGQGSGQTDLQSSDFKGSFRVVTTLGVNARATLGLTVQKSMTFGGLMLRFDTPANGSISQYVLGRWPPVQQ